MTTESNNNRREPLPFNREKFLFRLLAGIFIWQGFIFTYGLTACIQTGGMKSCPDIGDRYDGTVNVMVATTLALLGTSTLLGSKKIGKDGKDENAPVKPLAAKPTRPLGKP